MTGESRERWTQRLSKRRRKPCRGCLCVLTALLIGCSDSATGPPPGEPYPPQVVASVQELLDDAMLRSLPVLDVGGDELRVLGEQLAELRQAVTSGERSRAATALLRARRALDQLTAFQTIAPDVSAIDLALEHTSLLLTQ